MAERLFVLADSHGYYGAVVDYLRDHPAFDRILHLGDHAQDAEAMSTLLGRPILAVKGNNDWGSQAPSEFLLQTAGQKILLIHGHKHGVYLGHKRLVSYAKSLGCTGVFYGHTHRFFFGLVDSLYVLNPGSPSLPRDGRASCAILTLEEDQHMACERIYF